MRSPLARPQANARYDRTYELYTARRGAPAERPPHRVAREGFDQRHAVLLAAGGRRVLAGLRSYVLPHRCPPDQRRPAVGRAALRRDDRAQPVLVARTEKPRPR